MEMMTIIVLWILLGIIAAIVIILHFSVYAHLRIGEDGFEVKVKYLFWDLYPRKTKEKKHKIKRSKKSKIKNTKGKQYFVDSLDNDFENVQPQESVETSNEAVKSVAEEKAESVSDATEDRNKAAEETEKKKNAPSSDNSNKSEQTEKSKKNRVKSNKSKEKNIFSKITGIYKKYKPYFPMGWKYFKKLMKTIRFTDVKIEITVGREDAHEVAIYYGAIQGLLFNNLAHFANIFTVKIKKANVNCVFIKNTISGEAECYVRIRPSAIIAIAFCTGVNFLIIFLKQRHIKKKSEKAEKADENNKNLEVA